MRAIARSGDTWRVCDCCGGAIPPESQWGRRGEKRDGYCPGRRRGDGSMCGAFAARSAYEDVRAVDEDGHEGADDAS